MLLEVLFVMILFATFFDRDGNPQAVQRVAKSWCASEDQHPCIARDPRPEGSEGASDKACSCCLRLSSGHGE